MVSSCDKKGENIKFEEVDTVSIGSKLQCSQVQIILQNSRSLILHLHVPRPLRTLLIIMAILILFAAFLKSTFVSTPYQSRNHEVFLAWCLVIIIAMWGDNVLRFSPGYSHLGRSIERNLSFWVPKPIQ